MLALAVLFALLPALALLVYYYRQDRFRPEPKAAILLVFLAGGASTAVAFVIELGLSKGLDRLLTPERAPFAYAAIVAFLIAGAVEEGLKLVTVRVTIYRRPELDEVTDGIVYTIVASLGFALLENLRYYYLLHDLTTVLLRGATAVPMHAFMSGLMGYEIGLARLAPSPSRERRHFLRGWLLAATLHGAYDFLLLSGVPGLMVLVVPLLGFAFLLLRGRFQTALALDFQRLGGQDAFRPWGLLPGVAAREDALPPWWRPPALRATDPAAISRPDPAAVSETATSPQGAGEGASLTAADGRGMLSEK